MTLLDQAKQQHRGQNRPKSTELLDVALGVLNNEITMAQVARVLYPDKKNYNNYWASVSSQLWTSLRNAAVEGRIRIVKTKDPKDRP